MTKPQLDDDLIHIAEERLGSLLHSEHPGSLSSGRKTEITRIMRALAGRSGPARLVLMAGLQGSRKTQLSRALEARGFLRFSPDERVWDTHGHYGRDFPRGEYLVREQPILRAIAVEVRSALTTGHDVVMDHGFWTTAERAQWRRIGQEAGAAVTLVHLPATHAERWERIKQRNQQTYSDPNSMWFSEADLLRHAARFENPGPDEPHVAYTGDLDPVLQALEDSASGPGDPNSQASARQAGTDPAPPAIKVQD